MSDNIKYRGILLIDKVLIVAILINLLSFFYLKIQT